MFPSTGYFKGINCPFFVSGLCDRTYCHFRHSRPQEDNNNKAKENASSFNSPKSGPSYSFNSAQISGFSASSYQHNNVPGCFDSFPLSESSCSSLLSNSHTVKESLSITKDTDSFQCPIPSFSESSILPESAPEPQLDRQSLPKISGLAKRKPNTPPSYNPTPKSQNQNINDIPSYHPTPKNISADIQSNPTSNKPVIQYDPVRNYAVNAKPYSSSDDESDVNKAKLSSSQDSILEAEFSAEEEDINGDTKNEQVDKSCNSKSSSIPSYADFLTPSSYFTSKLSDLSIKSKSNDSNSNSNCQLNKYSSSGAQSSLSADTVKNSLSLSSSSKKSQNHKQSSPVSSVRKSKHSSDTDSSSSSTNQHRQSKSNSKEPKKSSKSLDEYSSSRNRTKSINKTDRNETKHLTKKSDSSSNKTSTCSSSVPNDHHSKNSSQNESSHKDTSVKKSHSSSNKINTSKHSDSSRRRHSRSSSSKSSHSSSKSSSKSSSSCSTQQKHPNSPTSLRSSSTEPKSSHTSSSKHRNLTDSKPAIASKSHSKNANLPSSKHLSSSGVKYCDESKNSLLSNSKHLSSKHQNEKIGSKSESKKHSAKSSSPISSPPMSKDVKRSLSESENKRNKECGERSMSRSRSISLHTEVSKSQNHSVNNEVKKERRTSVESRISKSHSHDKEKDRLKSKQLLLKKERRKSEDKYHNHNQRKQIKSEPSLSKDKICKGKNSDNITSDLFGDESDGSDSDVQIVEPPPQPPPEILELSDSEEEVNADNHQNFLREEDFDFSDNDTFEECLRIFQETDRKLSLKRPVSPDIAKATKFTKGEESTQLVAGKKRMAHSSAQNVVRPFKSLGNSKPRLTPAEVMHNRIIEMQKRALLRAAKREGREADLPKGMKHNGSSNEPKDSNVKSSSRKTSFLDISSTATCLLVGQKKREAHYSHSTPTKTAPATASNSSLWSPNSFYKKKPLTNKNQQLPVRSHVQDANKMVTIASTASKTEKRKAHVPTNLNLKRPIIPAGDSSKVPINVRQRYLNLIVDEFLKFCAEETAFQKGEEEEQEVYKRATNKNIYLRVAVNAIKKIRTEAAMSQPSSSKIRKLELSSTGHHGSSTIAQSHEAMLGGSRAAKTSFTLHRSAASRTHVPINFKGLELYNRLKKYILTEEQLRENNYPRPSEDGSSKAQYYKVEVQKDSLMKGNERICKRCGKRYYVTEDGSPINPQECIYHYSNMYKKKVAGSIDSQYGCCNERAGVKGCQVGNCHVNEKNKYDNLTGYMKTLPTEESSPKNTKAYSLDCEMVYTKAGLELARVTVIGDECQVVYETLVKPDADIIDYNTRFSGITANDMKGVETTLRGVQAVLLSMISDKTILIGHSLESDLTALKMIHNTVVDTALVFPHRLGLPYKRALRNLMVDHLQKIIQADDGGHDSKEDAISCMQLIIYKVKEDAKSEVRRY